MPRPKSHSREHVITAAMEHFWRRGYEASSMDDLVRHIGTSRHALYADFKGKDALFEACLVAYRDQVVTPAFECVEATGATLRDVRKYFDKQIALAESVGLPGPGCLFANTMTECAPHNLAVMTQIDGHNRRLNTGFQNAIRGTAAAENLRVLGALVRDMAAMLVIFTNGLWSLSRTVTDAGSLRRSSRQMLKLIHQRLST